MLNDVTIIDPHHTSSTDQYISFEIERNQHKVQEISGDENWEEEVTSGHN